MANKGGQAGKTPRMRRHTGGVGGLQGAHSKTRRGMRIRLNTKGSTKAGSGRAASPKGGARGKLSFPGKSRFRGNTKGTS